MTGGVFAFALGLVTQPAPAPAPAETAQPAPAAEPAPAPQPAPAAEPAPAPAVDYEQAPAASNIPPNARKYDPEDRGLGLLIAGPLTTALGIPLSLLGNMAWRFNCGPDSSDTDCARGTTLSFLGHAGAGLAYGGGIAMTGVGAGRWGAADATRDALEGKRRNRTGLTIAGGVLMPTALIGLGLTRLFLWLPTPGCMTESCVRNYQLTSTFAVGGLALVASAGAGMLMYGAKYNRRSRDIWKGFSLTPRVGPSFVGLGASGRF